ncbi:cytochrome P450 [Aspergillus falconensis]
MHCQLSPWVWILTLPCLQEKTPLFLNSSIFKNTYQYMTNMEGFLEQVVAATKSSKIIHISPDIFFLQVMGNVWGATSAKLAKFAQDKSGCCKKPIPGYEPKPGQLRLWHDQYNIFSKYLLRAERANFLADNEMADTVLEAFIGPYLGLPKWVNCKPCQVRDYFHAMCRWWLDFASHKFDRNGPQADAEWELYYGSQIARELIYWALSSLLIKTAAGMVATVIFAMNANSVPMCTWAMMEIIADLDLHHAMQDECLTTSTADPVMGLLYVETLHLYISINITCEVTQPITLDGYRLCAGSLIQAPSQIRHYDKVWSTPGYPATEFWAARNLKHEDGKTKFMMAGQSSLFLPYSGSLSICPGHVFAKQEILITLATLLTRFDIEKVRWMNLDGSKSDRRTQNSREYIGAVGIPLDRELRVCWRRLW